MLKQLYKEIPERRLYDTYVNINKKTIIQGTAPASYTGTLFTTDPHSPNTYDFTDSFLAYMNYNKKLLSFKFSILQQPSFLISSIDNTRPNNLRLISTPDVVRTYKLSVTATETYIQSCDMAPLYDKLLSEINNLVRAQGFDKQLYFFKLIGLKNTMTDMFTFMMRGAINIKTLGTK